MSLTTPRRGSSAGGSSAARPVQRWDPFREFEELQQEMARIMQSAVPQTDGAAWTPMADIEETEDAWIIEAEVPGVSRDDINVELRDSSELLITGEIKEKERKGVLRRRTRRRGQFEYRVLLPGDANPEGIEANLHDGILTVRGPKSERAQPRRIEVKANGHDPSQQK
jgi:HSP20 family protein